MRKGQKNRKRKNTKANSLLYFALVLIIVVVALFFEIRNIANVGKQMKESINERGEQILDDPNPVSEEKGKIIEFSSFVDKEYTKEEIEGMNSSEASRIYELDSENKMDIDKVLGSAGDEENACVVVSNAYNIDNQFISSTKVVDETELYYVVEVTYDYINQNVSKRYTQRALVFKSFYYNSEDNIFNVDDVKNVKIILDLKNYATNYSNAGKLLVQSFMEKDGQRCEYILYYLDVNYAEENKNPSANLVKETTIINAATGEVQDKNVQTIKSNLVL